MVFIFFKVVKKQERGRRNNNRVVVNFTCQLDWSQGTQILGYALFLGVSVRVFSDEISISRLSKADCPPQSEWVSPNPLRA